MSEFVPAGLADQRGLKDVVVPGRAVQPGTTLYRGPQRASEVRSPETLRKVGPARGPGRCLRLDEDAEGAVVLLALGEDAVSTLFSPDDHVIGIVRLTIDVESIPDWGFQAIAFLKAYLEPVTEPTDEEG